MNLIIKFFLIYLFIYETDIFYNNIYYRLIGNNNGDMFVIHDFYNDHISSSIEDIVKFNYKHSYKSNNFFTNRSFILYDDMNTEGLIILKKLTVNSIHLDKIKNSINKQMKFINDSTVLKLEYYNDFSGEKLHYDNILLHGNKWTGIYSVFNNNCFYYKNTNHTTKNLYVPQNSLILYEGHKIKHKVFCKNKSSILIFTFCTSCDYTINPYYLLTNKITNSYINSKDQLVTNL